MKPGAKFSLGECYAWGRLLDYADLFHKFACCNALFSLRSRILQRGAVKDGLYLFIGIGENGSTGVRKTVSISKIECL